MGGLSLLHGVTAEYTCRGSSRGRIVLMVDHTDPRAHLRGLTADPDIATAGDDESHTAGSSMDQRPDAHETTVDEGLGTLILA